jgi:hypothetical protein
MEATVAEETAEVPTENINVAEMVEKPRLEALLLADYASITTTGKPDVCGIFDEFSIEADKKNTGFFYLYIRVAGTLKGELDISFFHPDGKLMATATTELMGNMPQGKRRVSLLQRMALEIAMAGEYWVDISYQRQSLGGTSFSVRYREKGAGDDIVSG